MNTSLERCFHASTRKFQCDCGDATSALVGRARLTGLTHSPLRASLLIGLEGTVRPNRDAKPDVLERNLPNLVLGTEECGGGGWGGYLTHEERLSGKKAGDFCFVNRNWFGFSGVYLLLFLK